MNRIRRLWSSCLGKIVLTVAGFFVFFVCLGLIFSLTGMVGTEEEGTMTEQGGDLPAVTPSIQTPESTATARPTDTPKPTGTPDMGGEIEAQVICQKFVRDNLKTPSTAEFGGLFDDRDEATFVDAETAKTFGIDPADLHLPGVWVVLGEVDAQNTFGAMIRSSYSCTLDYDAATETWHLLDIAIE